MPLSFLNPNNWHNDPPHEFRIYGDDHAQSWVVVDEEDYHFLHQWRWSWDNPGMRNGKPRRAPRLRRNLQVMVDNGQNLGGTYINPETGREVRLRSRKQQNLYLHIVVMLRTGIVPPSPDHHIVDHRDSDHTNCRRGNLRWATGSINAKNVFGSHAMELIQC